MDDGTRLPLSFIITIVALLFMAAFFAVCETAISSCSKSRMKAAAERGDVPSGRVIYILDNFEKAISTISICTNIVHIALATVTTVFVTKNWGVSWVTLSTIITTIVVFFAGEMLPKSIAKKLSDSLAPKIAKILIFFMKVFSPFSAFLSAFGGMVSRLSSFGEQEVSVTEDELYDIIEDMTEEGALNEEQGELISSALQFGDVTVESIVTPRVDLVAIDIEDSTAEILEQVKSNNHSRLPVYEGSIDNIIGVLQIRRFIKAWLKEKENLKVRDILDGVMFVHGSTMVDDLLREMTKRRMNLAVVTDNYGGTLGIVTVEDILEELVGEIWDEDDVVEESVIPMGDNTYIVDAEESVSDVFEKLDYEDPEENDDLVNTIMSEWVYSQFPSIPEPGASFDYHDLRVTVDRMEHNRILTLRVELLPADAEEGGDEE